MLLQGYQTVVKDCLFKKANNNSGGSRIALVGNSIVGVPAPDIRPHLTSASTSRFACFVGATLDTLRNIYIAPLKDGTRVVASLQCPEKTYAAGEGVMPRRRNCSDSAFGSSSTCISIPSISVARPPSLGESDPETHRIGQSAIARLGECYQLAWTKLRRQELFCTHGALACHAVAVAWTALHAIFPVSCAGRKKIALLWRQW